MMQHTKKQPRRSAGKRASLLAFIAVAGCCLATIRVHAAPMPAPATRKPSLPLAALPGGLLVGSDRTYPFREAYPFAPYGDPTAHAFLGVAKTRLYQARMGSASSEGIFEVDIRLYNDSGDQRSFYNVDWDRLLPLAGCLALYDAQKHYVCDLEDNSGGGSSTGVNAGDWLAVPASGYIGKTVFVSLPYPLYKVIPTGTYYLQVIYHQFAVQSLSEAKHIYRDDRTELFRSNVVPITVVDQPVVKLPLLPQKP